MQSRVRAFLIHFSASALVLGAVTVVVLAWWYPGTMLTLQGGWAILLVILTVDLVLGPSLTGLIYKPGKKWLVFDISVIVLAQIVALGYGIWSIHSQKPSYLAFTLDRFYVVPFINVVGNLPGNSTFSKWRGSVLLTTSPTTPRTTPASLDGLFKEDEENLVPPLALMAADASPYPPVDMQSLIRYGKAIADLEDAAIREKATARVKEAGLQLGDVRAYRIIGRKRNGMVLVAIQNGHILDIIVDGDLLRKGEQ